MAPGIHKSVHTAVWSNMEVKEQTIDILRSDEFDGKLEPGYPGGDESEEGQGLTTSSAAIELFQLVIMRILDSRVT